MIDLVCTNTIDCNQGAVRAVRFNVDGSYCLTCGADKKVKLWNPYKGLLLKTYGGHGQEVMDACGSCDSSQIASCSKDKTVILWDVSTGQPMRRLRDHAAGITCVKYNEESTLVLSGGLDNTVRLWDIKSRSQEPVQILREAKDCISALLVTDFEIITASVDGFCRRYDLRNGSCYADFVGASITSIALTHDGQCILVSSSDNKMRLMDKTTGEMLGEYMGHSTNNLNIDCGVITSDDYVLSGSTSGELFCWDLVTGKVAQKYPHTKNKVLNSLTVHPNKSFVITACVNSVKVWETPGEIVRKAEEG